MSNKTFCVGVLRGYSPNALPSVHLQFGFEFTASDVHLVAREESLRMRFPVLIPHQFVSNAIIRTTNLATHALTLTLEKPDHAIVIGASATQKHRLMWRVA